MDLSPRPSDMAHHDVTPQPLDVLSIPRVFSHLLLDLPFPQGPQTPPRDAGAPGMGL